MKKILAFIFIAHIFLQSYCQNSDTISLKDLIVPSSPAFSLLDVSPKIVERPASFKALAFNIVSTLEGGNTIPKNFAMEFAPYWLIKHAGMTFFKYNGIDPTTLKQNIFYGVKNFTIAVASVSKDSSKKFPLDVNYISYSIRSNILNVRKKKVVESLRNTGLEVNAMLIEALKDSTICDKLLLDGAPPEEVRKCIFDNVFRKNAVRTLILNSKRNHIDSLLIIRPVLTLDAAFASSTAFGDNKFSNSHSYRTGGWINFSYSQPLLDRSSRKDLSELVNAKNYINLYGFFRILSEDSTSNFKVFTNYSYIDYGGRLEFEFDQFAISFESVHRTVSTHSNLNSSRNVGILQYKINDNLFLTGTFGKNFGSQNTLVAFLGINFGFGKMALYNRFQK
jgi:hypothetical protein